MNLPVNFIYMYLQLTGTVFMYLCLGNTQLYISWQPAKDTSPLSSHVSAVNQSDTLPLHNFCDVIF
jgi:hypothetical protein